MKTHLGLCLIGAALLATPPAATAATLATTFVRSPAGSDIICNVVNAGKKPIRVVIRIRDIAGQILEESGSFEIPPQTGNGIGDAANDDYFGWCEFEVQGNRKGVRASLQLRPDSNSPPDVVVPAY